MARRCERERGAAACPTAVRGSLGDEAIALGTLKPRQPGTTVRAQLVVGAAGAVAQHDRRDDRLAPLRRPGGRRPPASATAGCARQHRLDLGRGDVLAAGDDRVGLAAGDDAAGRRAPRRRGRRCAGAARRRRHGRARDEDLAVAPRARRRCRTAARRRSSPASRPRSARRSRSTGRPRSAARSSSAAARPARRRAERAQRGRPRGRRRAAGASIVGTSETSVTSSRQRRARRRSARGRSPSCRRSRCGPGSTGRRRATAAARTASARRGVQPQRAAAPSALHSQLP